MSLHYNLTYQLQEEVYIFFGSWQYISRILYKLCVCAHTNTHTNQPSTTVCEGEFSYNSNTDAEEI